MTKKEMKEMRMLRCEHPTLGLATVIEEITSQSGNPIVRVKLDSGEELTLLRSYVRESQSLRPPGKKKPKRTRKPMAEPIPDSLLVPAMEDKYSPEDLPEES